MDKVWIVEVYNLRGECWEFDCVYSTRAGALSRVAYLESDGWERSDINYDEVVVRH